MAVRDGYKRAFDLALVLLSHLALLPLWALLWAAVPLAVWLGDLGPVFYMQERLGRHGKRYRIIKFRTMIRDAERSTGPVWASEDDARLTRVGRLLRRFHLDEMPQVVNVVRGEMSLVGPRPERPALAEEFSRSIPDFPQRLLVKPGIAGLAQLRGEYALSPSDKLRYDILYIRRMSPWLDLKLLLLSAILVLRRACKAPKPAR